MDPKIEGQLLNLIEKNEDWEVRKVERRRPNDSAWGIQVRGWEFPLVHPYKVHITLYRKETDVQLKYEHMRAAHDYLWPELVATWNDWDARRFKAHCQGYKHIAYAGGASCAKSHCAARIACLFWLAWPTARAVIVSSTTSDSLETRIWGYVHEFLRTARIELPIRILTSKPPKALPLKASGKIYGMFAAAVREGDDEKVIATIIGRHPRGGIMFILDEATDMPPAIIKSVANLRKGTPFFQVYAIGNSNSIDDLHGALSTPKHGWPTIQPLRDDIWETTHEDGVCLYFNPYKSPAITEKDEEKRLKLAKFLPTKESLEEDVRIYGANSEQFYRMTLGFWKIEGGQGAISSKVFLEEQKVGGRAEWSGYYPVYMVGGYDAAFMYGGTGAVLQLAYFGHTVDGLMCLDFRKEELIFRMNVLANSSISAELQIARQIRDILEKFKIPLYRVAFDVTGSGRAQAELVRQVMKVEHHPIKIFFTGLSAEIKEKNDDPNMLTGRPDSFWLKFRDFALHGQVRGMGMAAIEQFGSRHVIQDAKRLGYARLETKAEYRKRMAAINPRLAHSPDEADAAVLATFAAIKAFGFYPGMKREVPVDNRDWRWHQKMAAHEAEAVKMGGRRVVVEANFRSGVEGFANQKDRRR